jgi:DNA-binding response OmpR family regulator
MEMAASGDLQPGGVTAMIKKIDIKTILVIEDEPDIQNFVSRVLELEGYTVLKAYNGNIALKLLENHFIDLIMLDLRLPGIDGWSILRGLKNSRQFSHIPVIVISAVAESAQRLRTLRMGAAQYLIKPLSASNISCSVTEILQKRTTQDTTTHKLTDKLAVNHV